MSITLRNIGPRGRRKLNQAMELLAEIAPNHFDRVFGELRTIEYDPRGCGYGELACTGGRLGRRAVLTLTPARADIVELAVTLSHEARHHYTDRFGRHYLVRHSCRDCSNPWERALDPIYQEDERLREELRYSPMAVIQSHLW
jgi:hypothetical protein